MSEHSMQEADLVERYLRNELSADELSAFEIAMLDDKALFEEVQLSASMREAFKQENASLLGSIKLAQLPFKQWLVQPWSLAASILLVVSALSFNGIGGGNSNELPVVASVNIASNLLLMPTRGDSSRQLASGIAPILITIDAGPNADENRYSVAIVEESSSSEVVALESARIDSEGFLRIVVNKQLAGDHSINVSWLDASNQTQHSSYLVSFSE